jgi:O-antigen ligase
MTDEQAPGLDGERVTRRAGRLNARALSFGLFYLLAAPAAAGGGLALAPLQFLAASIGAPWRRLGSLMRRNWPMLAAIIGFLAWASASAAWSPSTTAPMQALKLISLTVAGLLFVASAAVEENRASVRWCGALGLVFLCGLLLIEALGNMPLNRLAQPMAEQGALERNPAKGVATYVVFLWPVVANLAARTGLARYLWAALIFSGAYLCLHFSMGANLFAFAAGLVVYALAYLAPRLIITALLWSAGAWLVVAPFVTNTLYHWATQATALPLSWQVRGRLWEFAIERIHERPLMGWGLNAARTFEGTGRIGDYEFALSQLHPHSVSLNIWLECGAIGAVLGAFALAMGGWLLGRAAHGDRLLAAAIGGGCASLLLIWNVSFGAWQEWWIAVAFASAALMASVASSAK